MKILIIKPSSFGDIVQAVPCAAALKKAYPGCEISWVVFKQWEELFEIFPDADHVITWDRKKGVKGFFSVLKEIKKTEFDVIMDLQGLMRSAILAKMAKGKVKLGVPGMKEFSNILIKEVYPENAKINATMRNLEPVRFLTGKEFAPEVNIKINDPAFAVIAGSDSGEAVHAGSLGRFAALMPFARGKGKDWSIENYLALIKLIKSKYPQLDIVVLGSKNDFGKIKSDNIKDLCGMTNLKGLAAVLSKASVAVGADTGSMHLASVLRTPSVFIFGDSDINETSPRIGNFSLLVNNENRKEINKIKPEDVFTEVEKWIK
ncbi:MAG: glycosyltransferase family 9 protein [Endomicrobia bacterium]|nr:glycosyltransferase family 9 protein [Endomicrobiia bacterium]